MDIYLPIAGMSQNVLVLLVLGGAVGFLSGLFGVGGGWLMTPLLIFIGIPPSFAVAASANQLVGSSVTVLASGSPLANPASPIIDTASGQRRLLVTSPAFFKAADAGAPNLAQLLIP